MEAIFGVCISTLVGALCYSVAYKAGYNDAKKRYFNNKENRQ